jgi:predicted nucleic acid-binding protein
MIAIDTNVLIYACDRSDPRRQKIALDLIEEATDGVLLWQVACEFIAASRKLAKNGFTAQDAWNRLGEFMGVFPLIPPHADILKGARTLHLRYGVSFWDALILSSCTQANVGTLYSEDVPGHSSLPGLRVIDPFAVDNLNPPEKGNG